MEGGIDFLGFCRIPRRIGWGVEYLPEEESAVRANHSFVSVVFECIALRNYGSEHESSKHIEEEYLPFIPCFVCEGKFPCFSATKNSMERCGFRCWGVSAERSELHLNHPFVILGYVYYSMECIKKKEARRFLSEPLPKKGSNYGVTRQTR